EIVERPVLRVLVLDRGSTRVEHAHLETARATCEGAADPSEADDAERGTRDVSAEKRPRGPRRAPAARSHQGVSLDHAPPYREQQREREIGGRSVEHTRRVRDRDAPGAARVDVDPVVADAVVGDEA